MKYLFVAIVLLSVLISCKKENTTEESKPDVPTVNYSGNSMNELLVHVTDESGLAIENAKINLNGNIYFTDASGLIKVTDVMVNADYALSVSKLGYLNNSKGYSYNPNEGSKSIAIRLKTDMSPTSIDANAGGIATLNSGASVEIEAQSIMLNGVDYSGNINASGEYLDPTDIGSIDFLPNKFKGQNSQGDEVFVESHGVVNFNMLASSGEKLNLKQGHSATITFPISSQDAGNPPSFFPLYYFDEVAGLWIEDGQATLQGNVYVAEVNHFTFWMCPAVYNHHSLSGTINCMGNGVEGLEVQIFNQYGAYLGSDYTSFSGYFGGQIPEGLTFTMKVIDNCYNTIYTNTIGPFSSNTNLGNIEICSGTGVAYTTISASALDCNSNPHPAATIRVSSAGFTKYFNLNSSGLFQRTLILCSGTNDVSLQALDLITLETSIVQNLPFSNTLVFGNHNICNQIIEFFQYELDGTDYFYTTGGTFKMTCNMTYVPSTNLSNNFIGIDDTTNSTDYALFRRFNANLNSQYIGGSLNGNPSPDLDYAFDWHASHGITSLRMVFTRNDFVVGGIVEGYIADTTFIGWDGGPQDTVARTISNCTFRAVIDQVQ